MIDPWILGFSAFTVIVTLWMGFWAAGKSKTASDFFVAGRGVSVGWNASAISGEYLSAASFMGIAGMVMSSGYDALWYPVCYACGYLFLLLFIAGPLRRFGAYTIPDFAEGRYDSPLFRKIAVVFVLFIGFFYTMPQMKGAGTTLAYIFPGLPYWAGVVLVGVVITFNVASGGMKGITLVQAFQYWAKMFAISVPVFVLMAVYGHYGKQVGLNGNPEGASAGATGGSAAKVVWSRDVVSGSVARPAMEPSTFFLERYREVTDASRTPMLQKAKEEAQQLVDRLQHGTELHKYMDDLSWTFQEGRAALFIGKWFWIRGLSNKPTPDHAIFSADLYELMIRPRDHGPLTNVAASTFLEEEFARHNVTFRVEDPSMLVVHSQAAAPFVAAALAEAHRMSSPRKPAPSNAPPDATWLQPFGPLTTKAAKAANLSPAEAKPYALLYTYSLIMALVCGTAGLPHILVRFYTNPDGVAAKRTTMWVMILIGVFYVFPPVFGVIGRNLLPELYAGVGAKGTDKIVLELPRILNERHAPLGSVLSGITCAGAFAAFMSTFSGLLVSMTGALAHDVYGRILKPKSTAADRMRMFKLFAWVVGGAATVLGCFVEPLQINFMVGQAFAIAAASYFPLLFMSVWWRGMTMRGAATGMLAGGVAAVVAVSVTNFSDLGWLDLKPFWAAHPLLRILMEQPAIWAVPGAILLMIVISKLTRREVPADIRMKMLVLHAPEALGLKQEYIREHEGGH